MFEFYSPLHKKQKIRYKDPRLLFSNFINLRNACNSVKYVGVMLYLGTSQIIEYSTYNCSDPKSRGKAISCLFVSPSASISSQHIAGTQCLWINLVSISIMMSHSNLTILSSASPKCPCSDSRTLQQPLFLYLSNIT